MPASVKKLKMVEGSAPAACDVTVTPVQSAADREAFIRFPYTLYAGDPNWVPPLEMERKDFLDPKKNPWFEFGNAELFLARRNGQVVGRIAAVDDPHWNDFYKTRTGFFGMFESIDDPAVAKGLFDAAAAWVKAQGFPEMMGPFNFSTNYECAVLVEGFESPPPEKVVRIAEKIRHREGIVVRHIRMDDFTNEVKRVKDIYNAAWEDNWGFVPMTEVKGQPVAFSMTIPDANYALKAAGGRLTKWGLPIGLLKLLLASRRIRRLRLITLGIKEGFRKRGIDAVLYLDTITTAKKLGYTGGEISWTLEDNHLVNRAIEMMGGKKTKTYRIYRKGV